MHAHDDGKTGDIDGEKLLAIMGAVPETDRSVNPRVPREVYLANPRNPVGKIVDVARASTRARQSTANDTTEPPLQPRRSEGEVVLAARTKEMVGELNPWIRTRRAVVWGEPEPPCQSLDNAAGWIEREAATLPPLPNAEFDDALDAERSTHSSNECWPPTRGPTVTALPVKSFASTTGDPTGVPPACQ